MNSLGIVFPGQGSQAVGMLRDIADEYPIVQQTFGEASRVLDYDLWELTQKGPATELDKTVHTQPSLLAASYAIWRILQTKKNFRPALLAGHSLGEYTALVCAEALSFADGIRLVAARGKYMQEAVSPGKGGLAAIIGLDEDAIEEICNASSLSEVLSPANFNCPGQVVIAGDIAAVERGILSAKEAGAKIAKLLPVSVPSHCALMQPAAQQLEKLLSTIKLDKPVIPVINNVDVAFYQDENSIRSGLVRQLFMPVRWVEIIQQFANKNINKIIECGPGKVLTGLNKRIVDDIELANTSDLASLQKLLETTFATE